MALPTVWFFILHPGVHWFNLARLCYAHREDPRNP
jgi:hypothetical protein